MSKWDVVYLPETWDDIRRIDSGQLRQIKKGIEKTAQNPLPQSEGGYGKPLRNQAGLELAGLYKIKFKKLGRRVVYALERENGKMTVIVIAAREDFDVYISAEKRRIKYGL